MVTGVGTRLSPIQAVSLMAGAGVGAGIMAIPYLADRTGFFELLVIVLVAYGVNCLIHLMLAEVIFRTDRDLQVVELMRLHLLRGRFALLLWTAFALLALAFLAILSAYLAGSSEIVADLVGAPALAADLLVYAVSAGVVLFGLRAVGMAERYGALILVAVVVLMAGGAFASGADVSLSWLPTGGAAEALALYALVMYALYTFYTVPQVVHGLAPDRRAAVRAIVGGLGINALLVLLVAAVAMAVSNPVAEVASEGIADALGGWAGAAGSVFVLAALITSYWSISLALADVIGERTGMAHGWAWLLATAPSLMVLLLGGPRFIESLRLAGGATALVVLLITVPMYLHARRTGRQDTWGLGRWGSAPVLALVVVAALLMAVGSVLSV
jgi:amino acid permease